MMTTHKKIQTQISNNMKYDLKGHIMSLSCYGMVLCFHKTFKSFVKLQP